METKPDLYSIKQDFTRNIRDLDIFLPLIIPLTCVGYSDKAYKEFEKNIVEFNQNFSSIIKKHDFTEDVIANAKLFLDIEELTKLHIFCKGEYYKIKNQLELLLKNPSPINDEESYILEDIYFKNFEVGIYSFPLYRIEPTKDFRDILINGIRKYFGDFEKSLDTLIDFTERQSSSKRKSKIPAKYYALYHWILIEMGIENNFERDQNDHYSKGEIEAYAKERYPETSMQGFYREFKEIDITNKINISRNFGKGYKDKIIEISNNNAKIITHLKNYPN